MKEGESEGPHDCGIQHDGRQPLQADAQTTSLTHHAARDVCEMDNNSGFFSSPILSGCWLRRPERRRRCRHSEQAVEERNPEAAVME
jgi:hypothetical protein